MGTRPKLFIKNIIDIDSENVNITVSDSEASNDGADFLSQLRNRNNITGWSTTGSSDSATCYLDIDWIDSKEVESIILVGHNLKNYNIQRWNGVSFEDFDTAINPTASTDFVTEHEVPSQNISRIRINIFGTQVPDQDKKIRQIIVTRKVGSGQFQGSPIIQKFVRNQNRRGVRTLSGKQHVRANIGGSEYRLNFKVWPYDNDFLMIEEMYFQNFSGVLFWPSGGNENQFRYSRVGYRNEDIILVKPVGEFDPVFEKGIYKNGMNFSLDLVEVI